MSQIIERIERKYELIDIIETLESDLQNRPAPKEFAFDFVRDMMQNALTTAKTELNELTKGE